jgi:hypothetical protein
VDKKNNSGSNTFRSSYLSNSNSIRNIELKPILKNIVTPRSLKQSFIEHNTREIKETISNSPISQGQKFHTTKSLLNLKHNLASNKSLQAIKINSLIQRQKTQKIKDKVLVENYIISEQMKKIEEEEKMDRIHTEALVEDKERKFIRDFLRSKEGKVNINHSDSFYSVIENNINFSVDSKIVPSMKNILVNDRQNIDDMVNYIVDPNCIDVTYQKYLNLLKRQYQKEKDEQLNEYRKRMKRDILDIKIDLLYKKLYGNKKVENIEKYDYNEYLFYKYDRYARIDVADEFVKNVIKNVR